MANYTIKSTDLVNGTVKGIPLADVKKINPGIPLKTGVVVTVPSTNKAGVNAGGVENPAGMQGVSGVSNTGQGIPNIVNSLLPGLPSMPPPASQPTFGVPSTFNTQIVSPRTTFQTPTAFSTQMPGTQTQASSAYDERRGRGYSEPLSPADQVRREYGIISQPAGYDSRRGGRTYVAPPLSPADRVRAEYPAPTGSAFPSSVDPRRVDMTVPAYRLEAEYILPELESLFETMSTSAYLGIPWTDFNDVQRAWFYRYAPQEWIDYYEQMLAQGGGTGEEDTSGGGYGYDTGGGGGGGGGGGSASSSGPTYGLINWRI